MDGTDLVGSMLGMLDKARELLSTAPGAELMLSLRRMWYGKGHWSPEGKHYALAGMNTWI